MNDIKFEPKITTGVPTDTYKDNWERIFRPSLWRKRQQEQALDTMVATNEELGLYREPKPCGACGIDLSKGAMCYGCTKAVEKTK
jgi:hypothetical protein